MQYLKKHPYLFIALAFLSALVLIFLLYLAITKDVVPNQDNGYSSAQDYQNAKNYSDLHPIVKDLPIIYANYNGTYTEYRIDVASTKECQEQDFCLKITDVTGNSEKTAKDALRQKGYNPDDYEIIYEYRPITPLE